MPFTMCHNCSLLITHSLGEYFDVITATSADVTKVGEVSTLVSCAIFELDKSLFYLQAYSKDSWFPGYSWTIAVCPKCGHHMGW